MTSTVAPRVDRPLVFLSYAGKDAPAANAIREALERSGATVRDIHAEIKPGDSISAAIGEAITGSDAVVVLLSKAANESLWVNREIAFALAGPEGVRKPIVPVLVEAGAELPPFLRDTYFVDLTKSADIPEGINRLVNRLRTEPYVNRSPQIALAVAHSEMKALQLERAMFEREYLERAYRQTYWLTLVTGIVAAMSLVVASIVVPNSGIARFAVGVLVGATLSAGFALRKYRRRSQP